MMNEYVLRFMMGGAVMLLASVIGKQSSLLGGTISALPTMSGLFFLINILSRSKEELLSQASGGIVGMIIGLIFFLTVYITLQIGWQTRHSFEAGVAICFILTTLWLLIK